jgi:hypothetical protein
MFLASVCLHGLLLLDFLIKFLKVFLFIFFFILLFFFFFLRWHLIKIEEAAVVLFALENKLVVTKYFGW